MAGGQGRIVDNSRMNRCSRPLQWDIFCKVIDNFGDIGICWRLAADLAARGQNVRLWIDDTSALSWMAPDGCAGVEVLAWTKPLNTKDLAKTASAPCNVITEAFGCEIAPEFVAQCASVAGTSGIKPLWINLEYLSAEAYAERCHGLPSPVSNGPAAGWTKWFFYPGFTAKTGGLLLEQNLADSQQAFDRSSWLASHGICLGDDAPRTRLVSLFCYEPAALPALLDKLMSQGLDGQPVRLLVAAGRAQAAVDAAMASLASPTPEKRQNINQNELECYSSLNSLLLISYLPLMNQKDFDRLLWACDLNFVRGEDSVVRAIWAGKPFVWQLYPQQDGAHGQKLQAFLNMMNAPPSLRSFHQGWNAANTPQMPEIDLAGWALAAKALRTRLMAQPDLAGELLQFVTKKS